MSAHNRHVRLPGVMDYTKTWGQLFKEANFTSMNPTYTAALEQIQGLRIRQQGGVVRYLYNIIPLDTWITTKNIVERYFRPNHLEKSSLEQGCHLASLWKPPDTSLRIILLGQTWVDEEGLICVPVMTCSKGAWSLGIETGGGDDGLWTPTHSVVGVQESP